ncbi:MAG: hypothetical protein HY698_09465 [Deltaproteobacteria bacterium]|nr:hypothetical protein [Deltaproteobacteria bacterium]
MGRLRFRSLTLGAALFLLAPGLAMARGGGGPGRPFGLGLQVGSPTGLSGKYYLGGGAAMQFGVGEAFGHGDGLHVNLEALFHPVILARVPAFTLPFYLGVGGRILFHDDYRHDNHYHDDDVHVGLRAPFGLLMDFNRVPMDLFLELALVIDLVDLDDEDDYDGDHEDRTDLNAAIGFRYYF